MDKVIKILLIIILAIVILRLIVGLFPPLLGFLMLLSPLIALVAVAIVVGYFIGKRKRLKD